MTKRDGPFKTRGLQKGIDMLAMYKTPVTLSVLKTTKMSKTALALLEEFVSTGTIKFLDDEKKNPIYKLLHVYGIGNAKAKELLAAGITSIDQLREDDSLLNPTQKKGLKYVESTTKRIPRSEIELYKKEFAAIMKSINADPNMSSFEIVGSYRRGAKDSGDIDVIFSNVENISFLSKFLEEAKKRGVIVETLSQGPIKSLTIGSLPGRDTYFRRLDFLYSPPSEYHFATLYFTGSKWFNTAMRQRALDLGYSLNEHGFTNKENGNKVELTISSEQDIFSFLQMEYKTPEQRIDCNSVEILNVSLKKPMIQPAAHYLQELVQKGGTYMHKRSPEQLANMIRYATDKYSIGEPVISDELFDGLKTYLESIEPENEVLSEVGSEVIKHKVTLPYYMASMDKIKPDSSALSSWMKKYKNDYVISAKLDGISALYSTNPLYLYTRGNGSVGQDISYLIPYLNLPKMKSKCVIRGEIIISKSTFEDFAGKFANPRNLTAGIVNSTTEDVVKYKALDFVAYELIEPSLIPLEQMKYIGNLDINLVKYKYVSALDNNILSAILQSWKAEYDYEIDGIIVTHDNVYPRENKNPKYAFAFKMITSDDMQETNVMDVIWSPSKDGYLKPRLLLEPVILNGSTVSYATAFNGNYVKTNKLGPGSKVLIGLGGGVIPHIFEVTRQTESKMPSEDYTWSENQVDIILSQPKDNETVQSKQLLKFFDTLEVDGLKAGTISQLVNAGYNSVPKILAMSEADFEKIDGFAKKKAHKVHSSIEENIKNTSCIHLMCASNTFGRGMGEKKLRLILEHYPTILTSTDTKEKKLQMVTELKGMSEKSSHLFVDYIDNFLQFLEDAKLSHKLDEIQIKSPENTNHPLFQKNIVLTGFRDKELMKKISDAGGEIVSSVSKNTFAVLVKHDDTTGKTQQANKLDVPVIKADDFACQYKLS